MDFLKISLPQLIVAFLGMFSSTYCTIYVAQKLELNKVMKQLMLSMSIQHLIAYGNSFFSMMVVMVIGYRNQFTCFYGIFWSVMTVCGCQAFSTAISITRFYMARRTFHMKKPKTTMVTMITMLFLLANYAIIGIILGGQAFWNWPGLVHVCTGDETKMATATYGGVFILWMFVLAFSGILADIALRIFMKVKGNQDGIVALIPLESLPKEDDEDKASLPVDSVYVTICTSLIFLVCLGSLLLPIGMESQRFIILISYGVLQVPLIIGFTARLDQKKREEMEFQ